MTQKQRAFADEYMCTGNATRAYKTVYRVQSDRTAQVNASRLLSNAEVSEYVKAQADAIHDVTIANAREIMCILTSIVRGEISATIHEQIEAANLLSKMLGVDRPRGNSDDDVRVVIIDDV